MIKTTLTIDGMACSMCEAHVNDAVRGKFAVKKVTSSFKKGVTEILSENALDENDLRAAIETTGYRVSDVKTEGVEKQRFSLFG